MEKARLSERPVKTAIEGTAGTSLAANLIVPLNFPVKLSVNASKLSSRLFAINEDRQFLFRQHQNSGTITQTSSKPAGGL